MGLRRDYLNTVLTDLPTSSSVLAEGSPRYDELLGGRRGPSNWGQYAKGYGTTCIITTNGWLRSAGAPADLVWTEDTPQGGGTKIITHLNNGAKARGWLKTPVRGQLPDLRPGDIVQLNHDAKDKDGNPIDGTHVGTVVRIVSNDGQSLVVETADGGQGTRDHQTMTRQIRTFTLGGDSHPVHVKSQYTSGWLDRWITVGGDEPDDVADGSGGAGASSGGDSSGALIVGLSGVGLLLLGGAWYLTQSKIDINDLINWR